MEAVRSSETSVHSNETTWRYIPEDSKLHTPCRENLKSYTFLEDVCHAYIAHNVRLLYIWKTHKLAAYKVTANTMSITVHQLYPYLHLIRRGYVA
jgi:hypothetical protein